MATPYYNASNSPPVVQGVLVNNHNTNAANAGGGHIYDHKHATHGVGAMEGSSLPPHHSPLTTSNNTNNNNNNNGENIGNWTKGEVQPRRCNDVIFAMLFYGHLGVMAGCAAVFAPKMFSEVAEAAANGGGRRDLMMNEEGSGVEELGFGDENNVGIKTKFMKMMIQGTHRALAAFIHISSSTADDDEYPTRDLQEEDEESNNITGTNDMGDMMILLGISALISLVISTGALSFMIRNAESLIKFALMFNIAATAVVSHVCVRTLSMFFFMLFVPISDCDI